MPDRHILHFPDVQSPSPGYYSLVTPKSLIVFVHGFAGHAVKTWGDFIHQVRNISEFAEADVIFYGYPSLRRHLDMSALEFYHRLKKWVVPPVIEGLPVLFSSVTRPNRRQPECYQ